MKKKTLEEIGIEGYLLNMIKYVYLCPKANILFNGKTLQVFSLRSKTRQELNIVWNVLANGVRQERLIKYIQMEKDR